MDIQSVLEATFPVPTIEPAWQYELLRRLERANLASAEPTAAKPSPDPALSRAPGRDF
jgi:hypothetical protein